MHAGDDAALIGARTQVSESDGPSRDAAQADKNCTKRYILVSIAAATVLEHWESL
jgi:hypothetical protein